MATNNDSTSATTALYVIVVVVAVLVASVLAPVVWSAARPSADADRPSVAVITLRGPTQGQIAHGIVEDLRQARNNDSVEAVVLRIDSGGGPVTASEELYLAVNRTAQEMPVVAYVEGTAASGGYFAIAPATAIYVKPGSIVGSIGVVASVPEVLELSNQERQLYIRSGPQKQINDVDQVRTIVESLQNAFVGTVMRHRGDELTLSEREVGEAGIYTGTRAVQNGFADRVASLEAAIQRAAAESADIQGENYDVVYRAPPTAGSSLILAEEDVQRRNGSIVYVDNRGDTEPEFVPPVRFYAVWGIPADAVADPGEVTVNETG